MADPQPHIAVRSKIWLEVDGSAVFGDGKCHWLAMIDQLGSLRAVATALGMSYRGLWGRLRETERRLGVPLVEKHTGGRQGGSTRLTADGRRFLQAYNRFRDGINEHVDRKAADLLAELRRMLQQAPSALSLVT
jgi:molybdate transport system regulatory protein